MPTSDPSSYEPSTMEGMVPATTIPETSETAAGDPSRGQETPIQEARTTPSELRSSEFVRNPILPIGAYEGDRKVHLALPGLVDDIWESMKALKAGVGYDELGRVDFNPKDTLNVAGAAMTGAMGRLATVESAGLGVGGGRVPPKKLLEQSLATEKGTEYLIRQAPDNPKGWDILMDGKKAGEFEFRSEGIGGGVPRFVIDSIDTLNFGTPQGTGLSRPIYEHFKGLADKMGGELVPSGSLTEASYSNWKRMNPSVLEKGDYRKVTTPEGPRWERHDDTFSTVPKTPSSMKTRTDPTLAPEQGVFKFSFPEGTGPTAINRRESLETLRSGGDVTVKPSNPKVDVSYISDYKPEVVKQFSARVKETADQALETLKKENPELSFRTDGSGRSQYIYVDKGDETLLKIRFSDHGATSFDALSIDPVTGNTLDTVRKALKYELGGSKKAPEIGWSFFPPHGLRNYLNGSAGMPVFPSGRQIGGRAEYVKGGYRDSQTPYQVRTHDIGKDIQWQFPALKDAAE